MSAIDKELIERFVELAARRLRGEWVVMGGTVLHLVGLEERTTFDIDVAGPREAEMEQSLELMRIAEELGLPVEAINQAGAFFLHRIEGWREHVVPVRTSERASVLRPDATLFLLLKLSRLTESDLADCRAFVGGAAERGEKIDVDRIERAIDDELSDENLSTARRERLRALSDLVSH